MPVVLRAPASPALHPPPPFHLPKAEIIYLGRTVHSSSWGFKQWVGLPTCLSFLCPSFAPAGHTLGGGWGGLGWDGVCGGAWISKEDGARERLCAGIVSLLVSWTGEDDKMSQCSPAHFILQPVPNNKVTKSSNVELIMRKRKWYPGPTQTTLSLPGLISKRFRSTQYCLSLVLGNVETVLPILVSKALLSRNQPPDYYRMGAVLPASWETWNLPLLSCGSKCSKHRWESDLAFRKGFYFLWHYYLKYLFFRQNMKYLALKLLLLWLLRHLQNIYP